MAAPQIEVLGVHPLTVTEEMIDSNAMDLYGEGYDGAARQMTEEQLTSVALIEVMVTGKDNRLLVDDFGQPASGQAPYDAVYLDESGSRIIGRDFEPLPDAVRFRIAFYLYFYQEGVGLNTSYGLVSTPEKSPMPNRLAELHPFIPSD